MDDRTFTAGLERPYNSRAAATSWASLSKFPALLILRAVQRAAAVRWRAGRETVHLSDWRLPGGVSLGKRHGQATLWKRLG